MENVTIRLNFLKLCSFPSYFNDIFIFPTYFLSKMEKLKQFSSKVIVISSFIFVHTKRFVPIRLFEINTFKFSFISLEPTIFFFTLKPSRVVCGARLLHVNKGKCFFPCFLFWLSIVIKIRNALENERVDFFRWPRIF